MTDSLETPAHSAANKKSWLSSWEVMLFLAISVAVALHGMILYKGSFEGTYDSYVHILFGQKYSHHWLDTWVYNWFDGFDLASYPPLVHQLIAILSKFGSLESGYICVQLIGVVAMITGVFRFSRLWLDPYSATLAAFSAVFCTSYAQAVHHFGQLPNTFAVGFLLHAASYFVPWILHGKKWSLLIALLYLSIVITSHHLSFFLFAPILFATLSLTCLFTSPGPLSTKRAMIFRVLGFAALCALLALIILYPFISYVQKNLPVQLEIVHATRKNFFKDMDIFINFFATPLATVGIFLLLIPFVCKVERSFRFLAIGVLVLIIFGLGGTTPIPKAVFGKLWPVLTYDRFTAWATMLAMPFVGWVFMQTRSKLIYVIIVGFQCSILSGYFLLLRKTKFQPDRLDFTETAAFLNEADHWKYRYLTLGVGCQMARLGTLTKAPTVDGLYFTARTTKVLRDSGIEAIDFVKYFGKSGEGVLKHYLESPEIYHLRYIVVNDAYFDAVLDRSSWKKIKTQSNGVNIWEKPSVQTPLPDSYFTQRSTMKPAFRYLWGSYPLFFCLIIIIEAVILIRFFKPVQNSRG